MLSTRRGQTPFHFGLYDVQVDADGAQDLPDFVVQFSSQVAPLGFLDFEDSARQNL